MPTNELLAEVQFLRERLKIAITWIQNQYCREDAVIPNCWHCTHCHTAGETLDSIRHQEWCILHRLTPPTPTPGSEGGDGEQIVINPLTESDLVIEAMRQEKAGEFVKVRREDLEAIVNPEAYYYTSRVFPYLSLNEARKRLKAALKGE